MDKFKTSLEENPLDFEISESLTTSAVPFKINIVHDYLSDKSLPSRPSFQPSLLPKPPEMRQTFSTNFKPNVENSEEISKEKKGVRFEVLSPVSETQKPEVFLNKTNDSPEKNHNNNIMNTPTNIDNNIESPLEKPHKQKKHQKTVIISPEHNNIDTALEKDEIPSPEKDKRLKSHTFSSPNKNPRSEHRNSKLLAFSRIIDPLEKIDQENQASLELQANKQKLIFSDLQDKVSKYQTFSITPLEDFTRKLEDLDQNVGKFTSLFVRLISHKIPLIFLLGLNEFPHYRHTIRLSSDI
jgi:hypothetical protein